MGHCLLKKNGKKKSRNPAAGKTFTYLTSYTASSVWTAPATGWYRIFCVGACGNGGRGGRESSAVGTHGGGGAGGNSGGLAVSVLKFRKSETVSISINGSLTSFGSYMSAQAGAVGGNGGSSSSNPHHNGSGGIPSEAVAWVVGGNVENAVGARGGYGDGYYSYDQKATSGTNANNSGGSGYGVGGGGAGYGRVKTVNPYTVQTTSAGQGADGSTTGGHEEATGYYSNKTPGKPGAGSLTPPIKLGGGGGGGAGGSKGDGSWTYASNGGTGQPGIVIIDKEAL